MNEQHMKWSEDLSQSAYYAEMCTPFYMSHKLFQQQRAQQSESYLAADRAKEALPLPSCDTIRGRTSSFA